MNLLPTCFYGVGMESVKISKNESTFQFKIKLKKEKVKAKEKINGYNAWPKFFHAHLSDTNHHIFIPNLGSLLPSLNIKSLSYKKSKLIWVLNYRSLDAICFGLPINQKPLPLWTHAIQKTRNDSEWWLRLKRFSLTTNSYCSRLLLSAPRWC